VVCANLHYLQYGSLRELVLLDRNLRCAAGEFYGSSAWDTRPGVGWQGSLVSLNFSEGFRSQAWLTGLLREATGIDAVKPEVGPAISPSVAVMVDKAIGTESTERLSLQVQGDGLALCTWPAELKEQARATYRTDRAQRLIDFLAGQPEGWQARPNVHLAYRLASIDQRLYSHCSLGLTEYIHNWLGEDFSQVGGHHRAHVRDRLWPWLQQRRYADPRDDGLLDKFLDRLGRRDAHLRPSITLQRTWRWAEAADLNQRRTLASEIRNAAAEVLTTLNEPPLPTPGATPAKSNW
jgi:hypothetical protein